MKLSDKIKSIYPCSGAVRWMDHYETPQEAWDACERGDWMLWLMGHKSDRKLSVRAACGCARLSLKYAKGSEALNAIEAAEGWCEGKVTQHEVKIAADAAAYAADAAADAAAYAAAYAADAYAAADAADAAAAYAYAAAAAAAAAARPKMLSDCAAVVRRFCPTCPVQ